jgi:hypothetical protein
MAPYDVLDRASYMRLLGFNDAHTVTFHQVDGEYELADQTVVATSMTTTEKWRLMSRRFTGWKIVDLKRQRSMKMNKRRNV